MEVLQQSSHQSVMLFVLVNSATKLAKQNIILYLNLPVIFFVYTKEWK